MTLITLRVLDGADRGRVFADMPTPLTIGREEGNAVQLNDERVSRYHLKIQEDDDRLVLTDLESTNGTKINGESVQLWVLKPGDVIAVGRSVLVFGSREEIAERLAALRGVDLADGVTMSTEDLDQDSGSIALDFEMNFTDDPDAQVLLHTLMPPELPSSMSAGQVAQLSELMMYIHLRLRNLIEAGRMKDKKDQVVLEMRNWQNLIDLQDRLAGYLREIGEPLE
jgi:predicted component of type VI protein secretion system